MATKEMQKTKGTEQPRVRIPLREYVQFRLAKDRVSVERLNEKNVQSEMEKEARIARNLERDGELWPGNGLEMFLHACRRRLSEPRWSGIVRHAHNVRKYAYFIATAWKSHGESQEPEMLGTPVETLAYVAGYHDIGKTFVASYLINKETGTWFGIGNDKRIDFEKELVVLRESHVEAGVDFLDLYKDFMGIEEYHTARWIIGGHHLAYDAEGSAGAPSYPKILEGLDAKAYVERYGLPLAARIIRTADVYAAIGENRFYLEESERIVNMVKTLKPDDTALGVLVAVAGTDVDPMMVKCLIAGKYKVTPEAAEGMISELSCTKKEYLRLKGGDMRFSLETVLPSPRFISIISRKRSSDWEDISQVMRAAELS